MNKTRAEENPLSQDFDIKSLLKFAFPTIVMMLLMGLYTIADTIFVARFVGTNALSALDNGGYPVFHGREWQPAFQKAGFDKRILVDEEQNYETGEFFIQSVVHYHSTLRT